MIEPSEFVLPKDIKDKWIKALTSGKYTQGTGSLKTKEGHYCCLGVLEMECDGDVEKNPAHSSGYAGVPTFKWLKSHNIQMGGYVMAVLTEMNDGDGEYDDTHSFDTIASWIKLHARES